MEFLALQLDPLQERTLRIAFRKFENPDVRLSVCKRQRLSGTNHRQLPLTLGFKCTSARCSCTPNYLLLVGMDGGMGDGTTTFVRLHSALGPCVECLPLHPTLCSAPHPLAESCSARTRVRALIDYTFIYTTVVYHYSITKTSLLT